MTRCADCKGVAHPATGCQYTETMVICERCTRRFWAWLQQHQWKWSWFYECAGRYT